MTSQGGFWAEHSRSVPGFGSAGSVCAALQSRDAAAQGLPPHLALLCACLVAPPRNA